MGFLLIYLIHLKFKLYELKHSKEIIKESKKPAIKKEQTKTRKLIEYKDSKEEEIKRIKREKMRAYRAKKKAFENIQTPTKGKQTNLP